MTTTLFALRPRLSALIPRLFALAPHYRGARAKLGGATAKQNASPILPRSGWMHPATSPSTHRGGQEHDNLAQPVRRARATYLATP